MPKTIKPRSIAWYGWKPDLPDHRDLVFRPTLARLPPGPIDLRQLCPPHMDQGALGSCTAHGITGAMRYERMRLGMPDLPMSRLQLYYDERRIEGTVRQDAGAAIRDGIKCVVRLGVAPEDQWPYDIAKFKRRAPASVYVSALADQALQYQRVMVSPQDIKAAIASGHPVVVGFTVYESFESIDVENTGVVPMPSAMEADIGGHCVYVVGYGQKVGYFTCRNSWGDQWGDAGDFYMPEAYLGSPSFGGDYWIITNVEGAVA